MTDGTLLGSAYFYQMLKLMARYARLTGQAGDAGEFERWGRR